MNTGKTYQLFAFVAIVYMFFNTAGLPEGLYYTTLLTPFFFIGLIKRQALPVYAWFLSGSVVIACLQLHNVEHLQDYIVSFILLQTLAVFVLNTWFYLNTHTDTEPLMKQLATVNIILVLIALCILPLKPLRPLLWYMVPISPGVPIIPRLKLFTYEASYYSLIIFPLVAYYTLKLLVFRSRHYIIFLSLCGSLMLSFSLGVLATCVLSILLLLLFNLQSLRKKVNLNLLAGLAGSTFAGLTFLYVFFPKNPLFWRINNIFKGIDTSARGRLTESFYIAWKIAGMKSQWLGTGLGQPKHVGKAFVNRYYIYSNIHITRVPNAVAETLSIYGWTGIALRFAAIFFLFYKTKVWTNYYRQLLFIFIFIYQFTGSYLFNPAEYILWVLAFSPALFPRFNTGKL